MVLPLVMDIQLRHNPSFSVARAILEPNESIRAESGAMMAMAADTSLDAKIEGGLMKGPKRSGSARCVMSFKVTAGLKDADIDLPLHSTAFAATPQGASSSRRSV
jgi:uncharacterized protein (AIM24 family)